MTREEERRILEEYYSKGLLYPDLPPDSSMVVHPAQLQRNFDIGAVRGTVGEPQGRSWGNLGRSVGRDIKQVGRSILEHIPEATGILEFFQPQTESGVYGITGFETSEGVPLEGVGTYDLGDTTKENLGGSPPYGEQALLTSPAATAFRRMEAAYGKTIPLESAFRDLDHNTAVGGHEDSNHMKAISLDVSDDDANEWIKANGEEYGWYFPSYIFKGKPNANHFNFVDPKAEYGTFIEEED